MGREIVDRRKQQADTTNDIKTRFEFIYRWYNTTSLYDNDSPKYD